jgi:hypothetical protein
MQSVSLEVLSKFLHEFLVPTKHDIWSIHLIILGLNTITLFIGECIA